MDGHVSLTIFAQILLGVRYLHGKCLMHRDLRPTNIFIFRHGSEESEGSNVVKIGDFSVSTDAVPYLYAESHNAEAGQTNPERNDAEDILHPVIGDYAYASPEQRRGVPCSQSVSLCMEECESFQTDSPLQTDIFSLGVILFELFYDCTKNRDRLIKELRRRILPSQVLLDHPQIVRTLKSPLPLLIMRCIRHPSSCG